MSEAYDEVAAEGNRIAGARAKAVAEYVARELADVPDAIEVDVVEGGRETTLFLHADSSDMGRIIGRRGRTAQSIRVLVRAAAAKDGHEVDVDFVD